MQTSGNPLLMAMAGTQTTPPAPMAPQMPSNMSVSPQLQAMLTGGDPEEIDVKDSAGLKSGKYPKAKILNTIKAAKALGVDPLVAIAVGIQEQGLGKHGNKTTEEGRSRRNRSGTGNVSMTLFDQKDLEKMDALIGSGLSRDELTTVYALKKKLDYAKSLGHKDEAMQLQAYNGYGTITKEHFGGADKAYGVPIGSGIDLKKNPLYGKRLLQLKKDLASNKAIAELLK